jgi:hypothetical protein
MDTKILRPVPTSDFHHETISRNASEESLFKITLAIRKLPACPTPLAKCGFRPWPWDYFHGPELCTMKTCIGLHDFKGLVIGYAVASNNCNSLEDKARSRNV